VLAALIKDWDTVLCLMDLGTNPGARAGLRISSLLFPVVRSDEGSRFSRHDVESFRARVKVIRKMVAMGIDLNDRSYFAMMGEMCLTLLVSACQRSRESPRWRQSYMRSARTPTWSRYSALSTVEIRGCTVSYEGVKSASELPTPRVCQTTNRPAYKHRQPFMLIPRAGRRL